MLLFFFFFGHSYLGSLGFGTFGIVRVWVPLFIFFFYFFFFLCVCESGLGSLPFLFLNDMVFTLFFFCDFCVRICDFEREKYKSKIFVFVFVFVLGFVFVILKWKIKNLKFLCLCLGFWWLLWYD